MGFITSFMLMSRVIKFGKIFVLLGCFPLLTLPVSAGMNVVVIGDSLTAEYDVIPPIPGFPDLPTDYAKVTVPGWESMSCIEVLGKLSHKSFDFGGYKNLPDMWSVPRVSGYELNWAVPGIYASQYAEFVTSTIFDNPAYFALRQPLEDELRNDADGAIIWLGGNEFRANYGAIYDGGSSDALVDGLIDDLGRIIDFVQRKNSDLQIVVGNIPDLGATPSKKLAHPDPVRRALVTAAVESANQRIADLATARHVVVADVYSQTKRLVQNNPTYFGAVQIINDKDADNNPLYHFCRDGLHPNTPSQIEIARLIIRAFNQGYHAGIAQITDAKALGLLGINPNQPYFDWLASHSLPHMVWLTDNDADGLINLVEYAFGLDPSQPDAGLLPVSLTGSVPGIAGAVSVTYTPDPNHTRLVRVIPQYSTDQVTWKTIPIANTVHRVDGSIVAVVPPAASGAAIRLRVNVLRPLGTRIYAPPPSAFVAVN
jgi:lysophospholipase L1-like esterase